MHWYFKLIAGLVQTARRYCVLVDDERLSIPRDQEEVPLTFKERFLTFLAKGLVLGRWEIKFTWKF